MRIFLGGHLNFYQPQKDKWLELELEIPTPLTKILNQAGIPRGEVHLVVVNGEMEELQQAIIQPEDEVKLFSAVGGG
jgi:sulfur carrier protein ThiS